LKTLIPNPFFETALQQGAVFFCPKTKAVESNHDRFTKERIGSIGKNLISVSS